MKFKVGQKVRMKHEEDEAQKGDIGIIKGKSKTFDVTQLYVVEFPCFAKDGRGHNCEDFVPSGNGHWITEKYLESIPQTLEDKLELFKAGTHVLHTPTQEIYDKLMVELEKRGLALVGGGHLKDAKRFWSDHMEDTYVRYVPDGQHYGTKKCYIGMGKEFIELTLEDFRMGNAHRVSDSEQEEHMKITIETDGHHKTTAECNGITTESLCNPTDDFKLPKGVHMAVQRLLEKLKEDTCFHVGDIVEVVANEQGYIGDPVGLQAVVTGVGKDGATVDIPIPGSPLHFWDRELKLIRRGNN